jgi:hypothetical protein
MNIDWKRLNLVLLGRIAGVAIIVAGTLLSWWQVSDFGDPFDSGDKVRYFLMSSLTYLGSGGLLILAAEIADRLTWSWEEGDAVEREEPTPEATETS